LWAGVRPLPQPLARLRARGVDGVGQSTRLLVIQNPATKLASRSQPIIKHYLRPADALLSAASE